MNRRKWLLGVAAVGAGGTVLAVTGRRAPTPEDATAVAAAAGAESAMQLVALQRDWRMLLAEGVTPPSPTDKVGLSSEEWRKRLDKAAFNVLREEGTEPAGSSPLNKEKRAGVYACAGCDLPLFTSAMKYESGTGWPSFFTTIPDVFGTKKDFHLIYPRTEYHCARCGGHHGHLFDDGPKPTGLRYCNNGVALKFIPKSAKA
jgi:peptide-methionine (R)-S-oxide reductase